MQLDVAFILDLSGSMDEAYGMVVEFARRMVHEFTVRPDDSIRVAVITYSNTSSVEFYLNQYDTYDKLDQALYFQRSCKRSVLRLLSCMLLLIIIIIIITVFVTPHLH